MIGLNVRQRRPRSPGGRARAWDRPRGPSSWTVAANDIRLSARFDPHRTTRRTARLRTLIVILAGVLACLGAPYIHPPIRIIYNASPSIARGWYLIVPPGRLRVGMVVIAHIPSWAARLAAERNYLPITVPVIKRIAAADGQSVCEQSGRLAIDGHVIARALTADSAGRPLPAWHGCRTLDRGEFFLLGDTWDSYDSRYFGPITGRGIIGRAIPLWTWQ